MTLLSVSFVMYTVFSFLLKMLTTPVEFSSCKILYITIQASKYVKILSLHTFYFLYLRRLLYVGAFFYLTQEVNVHVDQ